MKYITNVCQLMGRCDDHWEDVRRHLEGMTVVRKCDSHQGGVKGIRKVCQLIERCDAQIRSVQSVGSTLDFLEIS